MLTYSMGDKGSAPDNSGPSRSGSEFWYQYLARLEETRGTDPGRLNWPAGRCVFMAGSVLGKREWGQESERCDSSSWTVS